MGVQQINVFLVPEGMAKMACMCMGTQRKGGGGHAISLRCIVGGGGGEMSCI